MIRRAAEASGPAWHRLERLRRQACLATLGAAVPAAEERPWT